jgi:hypothetical protein
MAEKDVASIAEVGQENGPNSVPMTPSSSTQSSIEDDSDYRSDSDTSATSDDEEEPKTLEKSKSESTDKDTVKDSISEKEKSTSTSVSLTPTGEDLEQSEKQYLSLHQFLLPKLRMLKILMEIDPLAGTIIIGNTIIQGFLNSLKASTGTVLTAAILELIMNKKSDTHLLLRLLGMHLIYGICDQILSALNCVAHRRARRPIQKKLGVDLMKAYAALPYEMMLNKEISREFAEVRLYLIGLT